MRKKILFCLIAACLILSPLLAVNDGRMIEYDSPLYDYVDTLFLLKGKAKGSTDRPWSEAQARMLLSSIDRESLSSVERELYDRALDIIDKAPRFPMGEDSAVGVGLDVNLELYAHNDSSFNTEDWWVRTWSDRKPLFSIWFEGEVGETFYTYADILYRKSRAGAHDHYERFGDTDLLSKDKMIGAWELKDADDISFVASSKYFSDNLATNFYTDTYDFDFIWPRRAIFSFGGDNWNASWNRDRMKIGDSHIGNLVVDDWNDYNNYLRLSFFSSGFSYNWYLLTLNSLSNDNESEANEFGHIYMIHTLDFRLSDLVSLKLSENVMYKYSTFSLEYMNPAFFYHNLNNRTMFNAIALIEVNASPMPGLGVYGQYVLDQARAPNEDDSQSDSSGIIIGAEYSTAAGKGIAGAYAEYLSTTPLLYRRDLVDFIKIVRYYHQDSDDGSYGHIPFFEFIGFRYGGDSRALKVGGTYTVPGVWSLEASVEAFEHGSVTMYTSHNVDGNNGDDANLPYSTPSGDTIIRTLITTLKSDADLSSFFSYPGVKGSAELDVVSFSRYTKSTRTYSDSKCDAQLTLSVSVRI